jgi:peptide/nickel transport system substrate-binding protein
VLKVVPDDTMRGLELRKGTVDIVVNDLSPDIAWQLRQEGRLQVETAPGTDYAYMGMNLRDPILRMDPSGGARATPSIARRS